MKRLAMLVGLLASLPGGLAQAWPVMVYNDAQLVNKAETIIVGHVKSGSLTVTQYPGDYISHAVLLVTTFLKGESARREIPIILSYGLLPVPVRLKDKIASVDDILKQFPHALHEKGPILLFEDNPSEGCSLISGDIYQNQIWLLRKNKVSVSQVPSGLPGTFRDVFVSGQGVWGPQDVQPLSKESKYKALLK